jgi:hypothetical protein
MRVSDAHPADTGPVLDLYVEVMRALRCAGIRFMVGGTYALRVHAGISRETKDLDLFVLPDDWTQIACTLRRAGIRACLPFPHWLGKAGDDRGQVDLIFASGNGLAPIDDAWFEHAAPGNVFDQPVLLCPAEEMIWSKSFVMERERFDGADVLHIVRWRAESLDWHRILDRFGEHWRVLLAHIVLFDYVYPGEAHRVPGWVRQRLFDNLRKDEGVPTPAEALCRGPLLSRGQYLVDVGEWGYHDARLRPHGLLSEEDLADWTAAAEAESPPTKAR